MIGPWLKLLITYGPGALALINEAVKTFRGIACPETRKAAVEAAVLAGRNYPQWKSQTRKEAKALKRNAFQAYVKTLQDKNADVA